MMSFQMIPNFPFSYKQPTADGTRQLLCVIVNNRMFRQRAQAHDTFVTDTTLIGPLSRVREIDMLLKTGANFERLLAILAFQVSGVIGLEVVMKERSVVELATARLAGVHPSGHPVRLDAVVFQRLLAREPFVALPAPDRQALLARRHVLSPLLLRLERLLATPAREVNLRRVTTPDVSV